MPSIWSNTAELPAFPAMEGDYSTDVLIIGGGITGVLCAYLLHQAGVDYALVEADSIGCGITKNTTAKITAQHGLIYHQILQKYGAEAARLYLRANTEAVEAYAALCKDIDCDFTRERNAVYSLTDCTALEQELSALKALGFEAVFQKKPPIPIKTAGAVVFPNQAQMHPLKFLAALSQGLHIGEHTPVRELAPHRAVTDKGIITANRIVVATHFPMLNKHGGYFLKLYQHRSYCLALGNAPLLRGMYVDESKTGLSLRTWKDLLILGGGSHRTGKHGGGWRELEDFAAVHYPGSQIKYRWATQDCMTLDGIPYVGAYGKHTQGLYVATGFNKWGMTGAMVAARLLTQLLTQGESPYEQVFSPSRRMLHPQLLVNAGEALKNLLTPTLRRCPHMGCALKWNPREHTWDCPCHGSRFEQDGTLIDGPATGGLGDA